MSEQGEIGGVGGVHVGNEEMKTWSRRRWMMIIMGGVIERVDIWKMSLGGD